MIAHCPICDELIAHDKEAQSKAEQQKLEHDVFERVVDRYKSLLSFKEHTISDVLRTILGEELSQKIIKEMEDK